MNLYISDLHFGHRNVLQFDHRPFGEIQTPDTGDTNNVMIYIALFVVAGAMLVGLAGSKMRKRA